MNNNNKLQMCENGGCMAKLGGDDLMDLLKVINSEYVPEDSSLFNIDGTNMLCTIDFGPAVGDDAYSAGCISALHAMSDIYASNGIPKFALVIMQISDDCTKQNATDMLRGIVDECKKANIIVLGGHTIKSSETIIGLTIIGSPKQAKTVKENCKNGDGIFLSKPIGTGIGTRAFFHGVINRSEYQKILDSMLKTNAHVLDVFETVPVHSCTDITGFGLIGHLSEALSPSQGAIITRDNIHFFEQIDNCSPFNFVTKFIENNLNYVNKKHTIKIRFNDIRNVALFDPQTNGPLLLVCDAKYAGILKSFGFYKIGDVVDNTTEIEIK